MDDIQSNLPELPSEEDDDDINNNTSIQHEDKETYEQKSSKFLNRIGVYENRNERNIGSLHYFMVLLSYNVTVPDNDQFADNLISERLDIPEGKILVTTSATEILAAALELINEIGVLSPIAMASPDSPEKLVLHKP